MAAAEVTDVVNNRPPRDKWLARNGSQVVDYIVFSFFRFFIFSFFHFSFVHIFNGVANRICDTPSQSWGPILDLILTWPKS